MAEGTHYSKAPITEAILDVRSDLPAGIGLPELRAMLDTEQPGYPKVTTVRAVKTLVDLGDGKTPPSAATSGGEMGYRATSADDRCVVQARTDGFTFSRLSPYENWVQFREEARRCWLAYKNVLGAGAPTRLALRYINRLDFPLPVDEIKDYLRVSPDLSPEVDRGLCGFFMQLQIEQIDISAMLVLNEAIVPPPRPEIISVALDIDIFRTSDIPPTEDGVWEFFEVLHTRKNQIFEGCITDKTRELIK